MLPEIVGVVTGIQRLSLVPDIALQRDPRQDADVAGHDEVVAVVEVTGAGTTNMLIAGNLLRQSQGTSGGDYVNVASTTGISGFIVNNFCRTATDEAAPADGIVIGANAQANTLQAQNFVTDLGAAAAAGVLADGT